VKIILAIFLSILMLIISISDIVVYSLFKINQSNIIENFCVNKERPQMKCNGKCYLKKTFDQSKGTDKEKFPLEITNLIKKIALFQIDLPKINVCEVGLLKSKMMAFSESINIRLLVKDIFHPPSLINTLLDRI